jgi:hypothetical protein
MQIYMRNPHTGAKKKVKHGFSWTTLLFGFWPAVFRGDWKWAGIGFLINMSSFFTLGISGLVYGIVMGFKYNEIYRDGLREKGFEQITEADYWGIPVAPALAPVVETS